MENLIEGNMQTQPDVLIVFQCTVCGENDELLGVDETEITQINWIAVDVVENKILREGEIPIHGSEKKDEEKDGNEEKKEKDDVEEKEVVIEKEEESEKEENKTSKEEFQTEDNTSITLKEAISQFNEIVEDLSADDKIVRLVTENNLHLRQCLHPRAFQHDIELSDVFFQFFDIRKEYKAFSEKSIPFKNLREIAEDMIIESSEKALSSAESKCRFCARVTQHLLKGGHKFSKTEEISRGLEAGMTTGYVKDDTIIRSRGLPWQVSDVDVAEFFVGLNIVKGGVALCLNLKGRRNGEALVRFENQEQRDLALKRHKHHLLGRYIEVYKGTAQEFLKIAKGPAGAMHAAATFLTNGGEVIIRMRGLPFDATINDIVSFFGESPKVYQGEEGVMLVSHPDGSSTGDAFVLFETEPEGQLALKKHRENIGKRYVELFRSTRAELQQVLTMYNVGYQLNNPFAGQMFQPSVPTVMTDRALINQRLQALMNMSCLRMRGLPFSAGQKDILNFLVNHADSVIGTVHIIYNLQGRPSGEAFVQMQNPDQAHKCADDLHLKHMGERYIEVFQCSVQDMTWMLATSHANQLASQHLNQANNNTNKNNSNNNGTNYHPQTPSPPPPHLQTTQSPPMNGLISTPPPTITTNGYLTPSLSPVPMYTNPYPPMLSPIPAGFLPPPHLSPTHGVPPALPAMLGQMYNPESLQFHKHANQSGVTYITFNSPAEVQRAIHDRHRHHIGHMFIAH